MSATVSAQSTQESRPSHLSGEAAPAIEKVTAPGEFDGVAIRRRVEPTAPPAAAPVKPATFDWKQVALALGGVIVLILILRWIAKRMFVGGGGHKSTRVIQVLSRSLVSPRQQLMLVQVGRRLVVVGDCGTQMNALCEISDAEEVDALLGQVQAEKGDSMVKTFGTLFKRAKDSFEPEPPKSVALSDAAQFDGDDPSVNETRQELYGLMDKVRLMSRQFKRS